MELTSASSAIPCDMGYLPGRRYSQTSPGKNDNLRFMTATFTAQGPGSIGLSLSWQGRPPVYGLICGFCSSARNFALRWTFQPPQSGFLQIPPHDGHPCLWLTVPATESVVDFHHQVVAHARRTRLRGRRRAPPPSMRLRFAASAFAYQHQSWD